MSPIERLAWDSEFFHEEIGRFTAAPDERVFAGFDGGAYDCVYFETSAPTLARAAEKAGFRPIDEQVTLARATSPDDAQLVTMTTIRPAGKADLVRLRECVQALAPWSRFARDAHFGESAARALYDAWLERAVTAADRQLWVAHDGSRLIGCVTLEGSQPEIGLIAALEPGGGVGRDLLSHALRAAAVAGASHVSVTTQADNQRALRLYTAAGFAEVRRRTVLHWTRAATA